MQAKKGFSYKGTAAALITVKKRVICDVMILIFVNHYFEIIFSCVE